jgi:hypothetical protein
MGSPIFIHATWNGTGSSCKPLDFGHYSESAVETCRLNLFHTYMGCKYLSFLYRMCMYTYLVLQALLYQMDWNIRVEVCS